WQPAEQFEVKSSQSSPFNNSGEALSWMERTEDITVKKTDSTLIYSLEGLMAGSWASLICNFMHCFKPLQIVCD
ncbi:hypothetical protein, partial [Faecalibaculum rodentium]|uniref:hypothetical protein n=1 Tax=Faecalibaculum rodentium TaxID=1702221 RepID=UPI0025A9FCB0